MNSSAQTSVIPPPPSMKPNLLVVQPPNPEADDRVELFCESLSGSHYVYLIRPSSNPRDDSPSGVRFLNHSIDHLPGFADVDTVIAVGGNSIAGRLKRAYPASKLHLWNPASDGIFEKTFQPALRQQALSPGTA